MFIHLLVHFEKGVFDSLTKAVCGSSVKGSPRSFSPQTVKECFLKYTACCLFLQPLSSPSLSIQAQVKPHFL